MTTCEFCPAPATHRTRVAGCGDETINVCCDCYFEQSLGIPGERCAPDDDCWTLDYTRSFAERLQREARIAKHLQKCDDCGHSRFCHENGGCEYAPNGRGCSCKGFVDLDLPFDFYPAVQLTGAQR